MDTISKHSMIDGDFKPYRKKRTTLMTPFEVTNPDGVLVETVQGSVILTPSFKGFIALDDQGHPYPVEQSIFDATYEPA